MTATQPAQITPTTWQLPFGPGTFLFNRELARRERQRRFDAELAKLTPANIAAMEAVTGWLIEGGYPAIDLALADIAEPAPAQVGAA